MSIPSFTVIPTTTATSDVGTLGVITTDLGGVAIDYSSYYERIATALETIASLASTTGVRTTTPYDWTSSLDTYDHYVNGSSAPNTAPNDAGLAKLMQTADTIAQRLPKFK
jgi:hypothetical protein